MDDKLMTLKEVADYLRISVWTLYRWQSKKQVPVIKMGGLNRFRKSEIDQWLCNLKKN